MMIFLLLLVTLLSIVSAAASVLCFFLLLSATTLLVKLAEQEKKEPIKPAKKLRGPYMNPTPNLADITTPQLTYDAPVIPKGQEISDLEKKWGKMD